MAKNNRILIYADSLKRARFFKEFEKCFEVVFITNKLSVYNYLKHSNVKLIKKADKNLNIDYSDSLSVLNSYHSEKEAQKIGASVVELLKSLGEFEWFFIWNGTTTIGKTLKYYAKKHEIKTLFFEVSNIEGRVFADKEGVLAQSYLYSHPEILDGYEIDEEEFLKWREKYKKCKKTQKIIKSEIPYERIIDYIGYLFGAVREDKRNYFSLFIKRFLNKKISLPLEEPNFSKKYIFLPLQVSNDSQVRLFSKYDNVSLIQEAKKIAKDKNLYLYIKPHPAEDDLNELKKVFELKEDFVKFVKGDLFDLILNAEEVVVNNSTVGLEAMFFDKKVRIFGEAFYKKFDKRRMISYLQNYLTPLKYPQNNLDDKTIKFLKRFGL